MFLIGDIDNPENVSDEMRETENLMILPLFMLLSLVFAALAEKRSRYTLMEAL